MSNNSNDDQNTPNLVDLVNMVINGLFPLGTIVITRNAMNTIHPASAMVSLLRHSSGDWGNVSEEDQGENELALKEGLRILSVYKDIKNEETFWIITEWDRSVTTILLPEDY